MAKDISVEVIAARIVVVRGKKVMLDRDLAELYQVETRVLNQAVKRISQNVTSLKFSKRVSVFTEQGVAMLSSVLNSKRAIHVNITIMRAFVKLRELLLTHKELAAKIDALEQKYEGHDEAIQQIFEAIRQLLAPPAVPEKPPIGFK